MILSTPSTCQEARVFFPDGPVWMEEKRARSVSSLFEKWEVIDSEAKLIKESHLLTDGRRKDTLSSQS